ncbi:MAG: PEP-CTERM sorting domain-containing protein [Isosphaeraceae bacterium]
MRIRCLIALLLIQVAAPARADFQYQQNFDNLTTGRTQPSPGAAGQGGWYSVLAQNGGFGEIQNSIANSGRALHQFTAATTPANLQTIDTVNLGTVDVNLLPQVALSFDFYGQTDNLSAVNSFIASMAANGGPFPGFEIVGVGIGAGNGAPKQTTGLNVALGTFNGTNNNVLIPLSVGQRLAFGTWHSVSVAIDQGRDRYVSITVDGQTQDLSSYALVRSFDQGQPLRGHLIEKLTASLIPSDVGGNRTNDSIYWDNIRLTAVPEPASLLMLALGLAGTATFAARRLAGRPGQGEAGR